jgi:hypothetical protein
MEYKGVALHGFQEVGAIENVPLHEAEIGVIRKLGASPFFPDVIVEDRHLGRVSASFGEVRANEPGTARYENPGP